MGYGEIRLKVGRQFEMVFGLSLQLGFLKNSRSYKSTQAFKVY